MDQASLRALLDRRTAVLRQAQPALSAALDLQARFVRAALDAPRPPMAPPLMLPAGPAAARLGAGVPLLHDQPITLDVHFAASLFSRLLNALQDQATDPELTPRAQSLVDAVTAGALDPEQLFSEAFVQHHAHVADLAHGAGCDAELLVTLAIQAVVPQLRAYAEQLGPLIQRLEREAPWQRGYCPVCGAWPLLGEVRAEGHRYLRCAACGAAWPWRSGPCITCDNQEAQALCTLRLEHERRFWITACQRCMAYVKVGNAFDPSPAELLALDDLGSMQLDVLALERGYHRPSGTGFPIELAVPDFEWLSELV